MLIKILAFAYSDSKGNISSSPNNLITAWAMQKTGKEEQAEKFLQDWNNKTPGNILAQWAMKIYRGEKFNMPDETSVNENYRILQRWVEMQ
jgi:hypothetical protein